MTDTDRILAPVRKRGAALANMEGGRPRRMLNLVCLLIGLLAAIGAFLLVVVLPQTEWGKIDTCLDRGGRWVADAQRCEGSSS